MDIKPVYCDGRTGQSCILGVSIKFNLETFSTEQLTHVSREITSLTYLILTNTQFILLKRTVRLQVQES